MSTSKVTAIIVGGLLILGLPVYAFYSMRTHFDERMGAMEQELMAVRSQNDASVQKVADDLGYMAKRMNITAKDLEQQHKLAEAMRREHTQSTQSLHNELESKSKAMDAFKQEATSKLEEVHQDATTKFGAVSGEVQNVRLDLDATKNDLSANRKEIGDVRDSLSRQIATNATELAELRKRGERDYVEFDIRKSKQMERVADVNLQLRKTNAQRQRFDVLLLVNDNKIEKKDRVANEPVTFLVGRDRLRYELVVNYVDKDRIRGYLSMPKDRTLSAEGPAFREQQ